MSFSVNLHPLCPMKSIERSPYSKYLNSFKEKGIIKDFSNFKEQLALHPFLANFIDRIPHGIGILDYQTQQYLYVSDEVSKIFTGYKKEDLLQNGFQLWMSKIIYPDDRYILYTRIFPKILENLHCMTPEEIHQCKFSYNYRIRHKSGKEVKILQNLVVLETDEKNNPLLALITITDITQYKTNNAIIFTITKYNEVKGETIACLESFVVSSENARRITVRENEIIRCIAKGLSTPEIASRLFISEHTVKAHRKNIFEKTEVKNSGELVNYAYANGLI